ncbi:MAG TPA: divalent-cation tolerance protein CutA [Mycobacteriales bacterium]|nr:divalent-cation tolerance protein CutA [Mycobacteriales bacterium]
MDPYIQVLTTTDSKEHAEQLAAAAVDARLGACAQIVGPITSVFRWRGAVETETEWQVVIKTRADHYPALERRLREVHTYEVAEIIAVPILAGAADYLQWITDEVR